MEKYCEKCGSLLAPDALFCFTCGTRITKPENVDTNINTEEIENEVVVESVVGEENISVNEVAENVVENIDTTVVSEDTTEEKNPKREKRKKSVSGIIALILAIAIILSVGGLVGYKFIDYYSDKSAVTDIVTDYVDTVYFGETDKAEDMIPEFFLNSEELKQELEEYKEDNDPKEVADERSEKMDSFFGEDIVVTCDVTQFEHFSSDTRCLLTDLAFLSYRAYYDLEITPEDIYKISFEILVEGSKEERTYRYSVYAMCFDESWYLYDILSNNFIFQDVYEDGTDLDDDIAIKTNTYDDIIF